MKKKVLLLVLLFAITIGAFPNQSIKLHIDSSVLHTYQVNLISQENDPDVLRIEVQSIFSNGKEYDGAFYNAEEDADFVSIRVYVTVAESIEFSITDFRVLLNDELMCNELPESLMWEHTINRLYSADVAFSIDGYVEGYHSLNETIYDAVCVVFLEFVPIVPFFHGIVPPIISISFIGVCVFAIFLFIYKKIKKPWANSQH